MSPGSWGRGLPGGGFPRVGGDEPIDSAAYDLERGFSPRERG